MQESVRHDLGDIRYVWENSLLPKTLHTLKQTYLYLRMRYSLRSKT